MISGIVLILAGLYFMLNAKNLSASLIKNGEEFWNHLGLRTPGVGGHPTFGRIFVVVFGLIFVVVGLLAIFKHLQSP